MEIAEALEIVVGRTRHERYRQLCDPDHSDYNPAYVREVIALAEGQAPASGPGPVAAPSPPSAPSPLAGLPLAGDLVEALAKRIGADRLARWIEAKTGRECGCAGRREALNRIAAKLARWLAGRP